MITKKRLIHLFTIGLFLFLMQCAKEEAGFHRNNPLDPDGTNWTPPATYTITYDGNGNTGGSVPLSQTKTQGVSLTISSNIGNLVKTGYTFAGWNTAAVGNGTDYAVGAIYPTDANIILYAKWTNLSTYIVTYDGNGNTGGSVPASQIKTQGVPLTLSGNTGSLSKTGYTFAGWNTSSFGNGVDYEIGASYTTDANVKLFPKWITQTDTTSSKSANLLQKGGDFEKADSKTGWTLDVQSDAAGTFSLDSTTGTAHGGKTFLHIEVTKVSPDPVANNWHVQLKDPTYTVKKGYTYVMSMWARADAEHKAQISVYGKDGTYIISSQIDLTTKWTQYFMFVKSDVDGAAGVNFVFVCGYAIGKYDIDDVVITEEAPGENIYSNGNFEMGSTGWNLDVLDSSGAAFMTINTDNAQNGSKYCRVNVTKKPTYNWDIMMSDESWVSEMNYKYQIPTGS